jgi:hypothetical protein
MCVPGTTYFEDPTTNQQGHCSQVRNTTVGMAAERHPPAVSDNHAPASRDQSDNHLPGWPDDPHIIENKS